ncbi:choice-of-anchor G family protein [Pseudoclavibacter terrae]|uniref:choice-of-anchor G family protein n=1 Tax=Pseudoclavibacter terrae TaxID=1530195 RepID=UPI00232AA488|nr:choice-of-anchor G family protein [Pseudoclavibacter terrae]
MTRRSIVAGAAWTAPLVVAAASAPLAAASLTTAGCLPTGTLFNAGSNGRLLSGTLLGTELLGGLLAGLTGAPTQLSGNTVQADNTSPLDGVIDLLSGVLQIVTGPQSLGLLNQRSYANQYGTTDGASGAVANDGLIALTPAQSELTLGNLDLTKVFTQLGTLIGAPVAADLLNSLTDLDLDIGAVAGRTYANVLCVPPQTVVGTPPAPTVTAGSVSEAFRGATAPPVTVQPPAGGIQRQYILSHLRAKVTSDVVGALGTALQTTIPVNLPVSTQAIFDVLAGIPLLSGLVAALGGAAALNVTATVDLAALTAAPIGGANSPLRLDLTAGTVTVDLAPLLNTPDGKTFNNLPGNTRLFADLPLPTNAVVAALNTLVEDIITRLAGSINISITASVLGGLTTVAITGTLAQFLAGPTGGASAVIRVAGLPLNLTPILGTLLGGLAGVVAGTVRSLLAPNGTLNAIFDPLNNLLSLLFTALANVLVITVNAQNDGSTKDPFRSVRVPLPAGGTIPAAENFRVFETAALQVGAIGFLNLLNLFVARGTSGPNPLRP